MHPVWAQYLKDKLTEKYMVRLMDFVRLEREAGKNIYPEFKQTFNAFKHCSFDKLKVIILGTEPYAQPFHNNGVAFASLSNNYPDELKNIYREVWYSFVALMKRKHGEKVNLEDISPIRLFHDGDITAWANQGVLLWNIMGTVEEHKPLSHSGRGWERFTAETIEFITASKQNLVFMLWGNNAKKFKPFIRNPECHLILEAEHPSKGKQGFLGTYHFNYADYYIRKNHNTAIQWWVMNENEEVEDINKIKPIKTEKPWKEIISGCPF